MIWARKLPFYYGWINVFMAAIAMTATLPGRTHGLGLITKPLLEDLQISEAGFAQINLWSSLLGALFCVPMGYLIDRYGVRSTGAAVISLLGLSVFAMTFVEETWSLFFVLTLVRGFGQSALSIVSMAMIGKWFQGRLGQAMGLYSVLLTFGFIGSILGMGWALEQYGWRSSWQMLAWSLLAIVPITWMLVRSSPESCGIEPDSVRDTTQFEASDTTYRDYTVWEALRVPAFWVFVFGTSAFNLVWSSITLFNESILNELGFPQRTAVEMMAFLTGIGLLTNIVAGKLVTRQRTGLLLGIGLAVLALALSLFPFIQSLSQLRLYGSAMGFVGGLITVVHFSAWGNFFGRSQLGRIQGVAQVISVIASAVGPLLIAFCHTSTNSYLPIYFVFSVAVLVLGLVAIAVPIPPKLSFFNKSRQNPEPPSNPSIVEFSRIQVAEE